MYKIHIIITTDEEKTFDNIQHRDTRQSNQKKLPQPDKQQL